MSRLLRILLSVGLATVLLVVLFAWGDVESADLWAVWRRLPLTAFLAAIGVHMGIYVLRTLRFRVLIPPERRPDIARVLAVSAAHNLAAYVLPAKTGEASLVLYLKRLYDVPAAEGLASLLVSRVLDLAVLAGSMSIACLALAGHEAFGQEPWTAPLGVALGIAALSLLALSAHGSWVVSVGAGATRALGLGRFAIGRKVVGLAERIADALGRAGGEGRLLRAFALSVPLWLGVFLFYGLLARGLGLLPGLDLVQTTFGSGLAVLFNLLPVNGFAGFGTQEAGWVIGFGALGVPRDQALSSGLGVHLVQLFDVCLLGLIGHLAMGFLAGPRAVAHDEG